MPTDIRRGAVATPPGTTKAHTDRRRFMIVPILGFGAWYFIGGAMAESDEMLILDDFCRDDLISTLGTPWQGFSDQVMGGISRETLALTEIDGRRCLRLTSDVRLENNGGFIQMAPDLAHSKKLWRLLCSGSISVSDIYPRLTTRKPPRRAWWRYLVIHTMRKR